MRKLVRPNVRPDGKLLPKFRKQEEKKWNSKPHRFSQSFRQIDPSPSNLIVLDHLGKHFWPPTTGI